MSDDDLLDLWQQHRPECPPLADELKHVHRDRWVRFHSSRIAWHNGAVDELLRAVAHDATAGVMIASLSLERIHHPYDGGADVLLPTTTERDALKHRHANWLSSHPRGR